jgi:hypothetical protein
LLIAGLVYHNWDPEAGTIEISGAALPGHFWLTRPTLARMYQYPFLQCNCQMVVQRTPADNERLLYILARYGYSFVTVPRLLGRDRDCVVCTLTQRRGGGGAPVWSLTGGGANGSGRMPSSCVRRRFG